MILIDQERCIGCGSCARDCLPRAIEVIDKKAHFLPENNCMECGHCIAICPRDAVVLEGSDMEDTFILKDRECAIDPDVFMNHMKSRRTIRAFKSEPVEQELINKLLEVGRFSPTGGNRQNVAYHIYQNKVGEFRDLIIHELENMGRSDLESGNATSWYSDFWVKTAAEFESNGRDSIFFDAPAVIVVSSDVPQAASIAAAHMETMAYSLGLGVLYSGFSVRAIEHSQKLQEFIELDDGYKVWCVLVIGYPAVKYFRTVPRNPAKAHWD